MKTLEDSTKEALDNMPWLLEAQYEPLKNQLIMLAQDYDSNRQTSTSAAWGLAYRYALSLKPEEASIDFDPIEDLLKRESAGQGLKYE